MARHRRLDGDPRRLLVADLADEQDVGVGAEDGAQPAREAEPALEVDLDLVDAGRLVLDRILDRHQHAPFVVEHVERGVERRRLARAGRADGENRAVRLPDRSLECRLRIRPHAEIGEAEAAVVGGPAHDPEDDLLAVGRRQHRAAEVHRLAADEDGHAAVLRRAPLGDVELGHDLQTARDGGLHVLLHGGEMAHNAVHADADGQLRRLRLEVEVGRALVDRGCDQRVDQ